MAWSAEFQIDQVGGAGPARGPNLARIDLWQGHRVDLTPTMAPPGATYEWSFVSRPPGSTAEFLDPGTGLPNPNHATPYFIPDVWGTFLVRLVINQGRLPEEVLVAAVKFSYGGAVLRCGWRYPGLGEQYDYASDPRGWATAVEAIFDDICASLSLFIEVGGAVGVSGSGRREADHSSKDQRRTRYRSIDHTDAELEALASEVIDKCDYLGGVLSLLKYEDGGDVYRLAFLDPVTETITNYWSMSDLSSGEIPAAVPYSLAVRGHYVVVVCDQGAILCDPSMELVIPNCMTSWS